MGFEIEMSKPESYKGECETHGEYEGRISYILGREFKSGCPACSKIRQEEDEARTLEHEALQKRMAMSNKLGSAAIPKRFLDRSFDSYRADTERQMKALEVCKEYADGFKHHLRDGRCLMLMGKPGTGKTHLACAIANQLVRTTSCMAVYRTVGGLLIDVKSSYDKGHELSEAAVMRCMTGHELLIIDEVGATKPSEFELSVLFAIINRRYENRLPTIIVSNLPPKELAGAIGERCVDRLREGGGVVVGFDWDSMRGEL